MPLNNASVVIAPTSITASGGTALTWSSLGNLGNSKITLAALVDTDFRLRRTIDVNVKAPSVNANSPNGYTQARVSFLFKKPKLLANGKVTVNTARLEFAYDVETTQAEVQELLDIAAQISCDGDFTPTVKTLSLN